MAKVDLTPAKLANIKQKAEAAENCSPSPWVFKEMPAVKGEVRDSENFQVAGWFTLRWQAEHIAEANPATVLAMVEEIERFWHFVRETLDELHECYNEESCKICKEIDRVIESEAAL